MGHLRHLARRSALFAVLFLVALSMRMLVPSGWMPAADASGLRLQPCPGWTGSIRQKPAAEHQLDHAGHEQHAGLEKHGSHHPAPKPDHRAQADQICAFAGVAMATAEAAPAATPLPPLFQPDPQALPPAWVPGRGMAAPPPPQTGPPLSA